MRKVYPVLGIQARVSSPSQIDTSILAPVQVESEKFVDVIQEGFNIDTKSVEKPKKEKKKRDDEK